MSIDRNELAGIIGQLEVVAIGYALDPHDLAMRLADPARHWGSYENQEELLIDLVVELDRQMGDADWSHRLRAKLG